MYFTLGAENIEFVGVEFFRVGLVGGDQAFNPVIVDFVALEELDEVLTIHTALARHHHHDLTFLGTDGV